MTSTHQSPPVPLPEPLPPAAAAQALADAAGAAALAWARPVTQDRHHRAVAQLYAALLDLGIAARGLAAWQLPGTPDGAASPEFARLVNAGAFRFREAHFLLDDVLASDGPGPLPYPDEPGAALCRAARGLIPAWRQPGGSTDYRDTTVRALLTATGLLSAGVLALATWAPPRTAIGLHAALASLAEAVADLSASAWDADDDPWHGTQPRQQGTLT
jgi:hypothetical protein